MISRKYVFKESEISAIWQLKSSRRMLEEKSKTLNLSWKMERVATRAEDGIDNWKWVARKSNTRSWGRQVGLSMTRAVISCMDQGRADTPFCTSFHPAFSALRGMQKSNFTLQMWSLNSEGCFPHLSLLKSYGTLKQRYKFLIHKTFSNTPIWN